MGTQITIGGSIMNKQENHGHLRVHPGAFENEAHWMKF